MYKLVVCDIDGTLVNSKGKISSRTLNTINKVREKGVYVTVCTGRNIKKTMPIVKKLKLDIPFVCIDGIIIFDPLTNSVREGLTLDREEVKEIIEIGKKHNVFMEASDGHKYYKYIPTKEHRKYDFFNKHDLVGRIKSYFSHIRYVKNPDDLWKLKDEIYQVAIGAEVEVTKEITKEINAKGYENVEVRDFLWDQFLFINYKGIGKATGVKTLCQYFQISPEEVMAFGDEKNDLDMLEYVGCGVAMGNAHEDVKKVAKHETLDNDSDGVAIFLENNLLGD